MSAPAVSWWHLFECLGCPQSAVIEVRMDTESPQALLTMRCPVDGNLLTFRGTLRADIHGYRKDHT